MVRNQELRTSERGTGPELGDVDKPQHGVHDGRSQGGGGELGE